MNYSEEYGTMGYPRRRYCKHCGKEHVCKTAPNYDAGFDDMRIFYLSKSFDIPKYIRETG